MSNPYDASYYEQLQGRLRGLLIAVENRLRPDQVSLLDELIEANECGVALHMLRDLLAEAKAPISAAERDHIAQLAATMKLPPGEPQRMSSSADDLAAEVEDLLDAGPVGLYEFAWVLRGWGVDQDARSGLAREALTILLGRRAGSLAWVNWPSMAVIQQENRAPSELPSTVWSDPTVEDPFLALIPPQSA
jgi:hypothetical protein